MAPVDLRPTVELRARRCPIRFGDDHAAQKYEIEVQVQLKRMRAEGRRFEVAPRLSIILPSGRRLRAGNLVREDMCTGDATRPPARVLRDFVESGHVLDAGEDAEHGNGNGANGSGGK